MKKILLCAMLVAAVTPAWSQTKPKTGRTDPCAPIGQTANRELVYPMSCNNLPAPPPLPPQAEVQQAEKVAQDKKDEDEREKVIRENNPLDCPEICCP